MVETSFAAYMLQAKLSAALEDSTMSGPSIFCSSATELPTRYAVGRMVARNIGRLAIVCLSGCLLIASACATVAPYERERLARPDMELGRNADARAGEEHATAYREGSSGGLG
ncbi:MAG TPA: DUF4266 domain-containing protein, partial [Polyangiales bacterium]|nr:DUF4266 domain-containing protein [Polyangiales bacterium]